MKYLLVLIVLVVAYNIWRKQQRLDGAAEEQQKQRQQNRANPRTPLIPQEMVPCARCGLILRKSDALQQGDKNYYCSADHQRQGPA